MLNEYLSIPLLKEEMIKRDFILTRCDKDSSWKGGTIPVPFKGAHASSIKFGGLASESDISEDKFVRGELTTQKELFGTMVFNERDIKEHASKGVNEQSFLKSLLSTTDDFLNYIKEAVSCNLLNGSHFATLTADALLNDGNMTVDHPERFTIDQKVIINDTDNVPITCYVKSINMNTYVVNVVTTRGGATVVDFSANTMTVAKTARVYYEGAESYSFTSLRSQLLSAVNGGSATLFGQTKLSYPYLQCPNFDGTAITDTNLIEKLFDHYITTRKIGKGNPTEVVMSYKHLASAMKIIEGQKGAFKQADGSKASIYGWTSIEIIGPQGKLTFTGVNECDDDVIYLMDWKDNVTFYTNEFFYKMKDPNGNEYYTIRDTTGYKYLVDIALRGEFAAKRPSHCGIIHTVDY
jgi:hypothetical protein